MHALVHDQVAAARATLAGGTEGSPQCAFHRELDVGVGEDDQRIFAAELERRNLQIAPADLADLSADGGRAGKRNLVQKARRRPDSSRNSPAPPAPEP